jgi:diaminopimelate epimerase
VARAAALSPGVTTIRTRAAPASTRAEDLPLVAGVTEAIDVAIPGVPSDRAFTAVAIPNPHLIAFVDSIDDGELVALGRWAESAPPQLPRRANISFVEVRGEAIYVRTFERGVGLTDSCGSAMAASTFAAGLTGRQPFGQMLTVYNKGGLVRAVAEAPSDGARVTIEGNATFLYDATIEVDLARGVAAAPVIHARRADEVQAWEAALRALAS